MQHITALVKPIEWANSELPLKIRRAAYARDGYPSVASCGLSDHDQDRLCAELRPYWVCRTDDLAHPVHTDPTPEGAREIADDRAASDPDTDYVVIVASP